MRVAVLGAGAVGGVIAAGLFFQGVAVDVVDDWDRHVEAVRRQGLRIEGPGDEVLTARLPAYGVEEAAGGNERYDVLLTSVKAYDLEALLPRMLGVLAEDALVVAAENGYCEEFIKDVVGPDRTAGVVVRAPAALAGPGAIRRSSPPLGYTFGMLTGRGHPALDALAQALGRVAPTKVTGDLPAMRWSKLLINCILNPLCALTGRPSGELFSDPRARRLAYGIGREVALVAKAQGLAIDPYLGLRQEDFAQSERLSPEDDDRMLAGLASQPSVEPSMLQDLRSGRPTEIAYLNGYVRRTGKRLGVPTPLNAWAEAAIAEVAAGRTRVGLHHLDPVPAPEEGS